MPQTLEQMTPHLLALTETDQGRAVDMLIEALGKPPGVYCGDDPEFLHELKRRVDAIDNGTARLIPFEEVMHRLEAKLAK